MASLKDLRARISSVKATRKITKAMQMVAAAKLRRAQDQAVAARPYAERLEKILGRLGARVAPSAATSQLLTGTGRDDTHLLIVTTGERGLAGAFNSSIARTARDHARRLQAEGKTVKIMTVGRKGADQLRRDFAKIMIDHVDLRNVRQIGYVNALDIAQRVLKRFEDGEFDVVTLFFSQFQKAKRQPRKARTRSTSSSPTRRKSCASFCRETSRRKFSALFWRITLDSTPRR
jgi:F-type H+-transporting ATPase subunit gamma